MIATSKPGIIAGHSLEEWNAAHMRVESYFMALRVRNKPLVGELASRVIERAMRRAEDEPDRPAMGIAAEEMECVVTEWFSAVLDDSRDVNDPMLSVRGRLALLLADMPGKWQEQFLKPGPWPDEFVRAMRESYLHSGPDLQHAHMSPRDLDLGPIAALTKLGDLPYFRMVLAWLAFVALLVVLFKMTH
jgi:hypothetical protein